MFLSQARTFTRQIQRRTFSDKALLTRIVTSTVTDTYMTTHKINNVIKAYTENISNLTYQSFDFNKFKTHYNIPTDDLVSEFRKSCSKVNIKLYESDKILDPMTYQNAITNKNIIFTDEFNNGIRDDFATYVLMDLLHKYLQKASMGYVSVHNYQTVFNISSAAEGVLKFNIDMNDNRFNISVEALLPELMNYVKFYNYDTEIDISELVNSYDIREADLIYVIYNTIATSYFYKAYPTYKNIDFEMFHELADITLHMTKYEYQTINFVPVHVNVDNTKYGNPRVTINSKKISDRTSNTLLYVALFRLILSQQYNIPINEITY